MSVETAREATRKKEAKETLQERPNRGVVMGEGLGVKEKARKQNEERWEQSTHRVVVFTDESS
jgi:hypothetical protein